MVNRRCSRIAVAFTLIVIFIIPVSVTYAQDGGLTDSFDDPSLPGWEYSDGISVTEGVLVLQPDNFAVRFSDNPADSYSFDFKRNGAGVIVFRYSIGENGEYALIMHDEAIVLEHGKEGGPTILAESPWVPSTGDWQKIEISLGPESHQVSLDGSTIITTDESEFISGGGIGYWAEGEAAVEIDNLYIGGLSPSEEGAVPEEVPEEPDPVGEAGEQVAQTLDPTTSRLTFDDLVSEFTSTQANPTQLGTFLINLGLSVILSYILSRVYVHWGSSLSNRRRFAANFILITVTTTFIILVVRSSVALSLGLVGALSIVRFRSAIKEPEELAYLFFAIAIGIGLGDNQRLITVIALGVAILVLGLMRLFRGRQADFNLHLTVSSEDPAKVEFESILDTLKANCAQMKLIRFDDSGDSLESSFLVEFRNMDQLRGAKAALRELSESLTISFLDNKGIW